MKVEQVDLHKLKPFPENPKRHPEKQIERLVRSLKEFGWTNPILATKDNMIIAGHARVEAAKKAGIEKVPVIYLPFDGKKALAYNLADNRLAELAEWDFTKMADLLVELDDGEFDLELTGFDMKEIEKIMNWTPEEVKEEEPFDVEEEIEKIQEPKTKRGDIYQLGRHRLMCGDATVKNDVEKLMDGKKADMVFTDPPYGINYNDFARVVPDGKGRGRFGPIKGDDKIPDFEAMLPLILKENGVYYIFTCWEGLLKIIPILKQFSHVSDCIIWDKKIFTMSACDYKRVYEIIIYGWIGKHKFFGPNNETNVWHHDGFASFRLRHKEEMQHPTQKPLDLALRAIKNSSKRNDIVADLFGGSGTTLIASEQTGRICYMMEIDPVYCDVIVNRWEKYTGKKAKLIVSEKSDV